MSSYHRNQCTRLPSIYTTKKKSGDDVIRARRRTEERLRLPPILIAKVAGAAIDVRLAYYLQTTKSSCQPYFKLHILLRWNKIRKTSKTIKQLFFLKEKDQEKAKKKQKTIIQSSDISPDQLPAIVEVRGKTLFQLSSTLFKITLA